MPGSEGLAIWLAGGALALALSVHLAANDGLSRWRVCLALVVLGLAIYVGARAHAVLLEEHRSPYALLTWRTWLGWSLRLPGGVLLSTALLPIVAAALRLPFWRLWDIATVAAAALFAVGRITCHWGGCCFGGLCSFPWAISYPTGTPAWALHVQRGWIDATAPHSLPIHPFALYMAASSAVILVLLLAIRHRGAQPGTMALLGLALLAIAFGGIEGLRDTIGNRPPLYRQETWLALGGLAGMALIVRYWLTDSKTLSLRTATPESR